jgi:hypothetical protein
VIDEEKHTATAPAAVSAYDGRKLLLEDRFDRAELGSEWKTSLSSRPGTSLKLARESLAIEAPANSFCFAERVLPPGCTLAECRVFSGTDQGASWGPGLALVWKNRALRINLRAEGRFGIDSAGSQLFGGVVTPGTWFHVRVRIEPKEVIVEASRNGKLWYRINALGRSAFEGDPIAVRLGKMNSAAGAADFTTPGPVGSSAIKDLRVYGASARTPKE